MILKISTAFLAATVSCALGVEPPRTDHDAKSAEPRATVEPADGPQSASKDQPLPTGRPSLDEVKARRLAAVIIPAPARPDPASTAKRPEAKPILVPSNTLGPGEPLWLRSDRQAAESRIARAVAQLAEQEAARDPDDDCDGLVVYGPHAPRWAVRAWYRDGLRPPRRTGPGLVQRPDESFNPPQPTDDVFDRAQLRFAETARPRIQAPIEAQQRAQIRFSEIARPPIARIQNDIDQAQLKLRKDTAKPR
ncbi:MAG: hypothetical protein ACK4WH_08440 [Phycisphaerales bacterium]